MQIVPRFSSGDVNLILRAFIRGIKVCIFDNTAKSGFPLFAGMIVRCVSLNITI